MFNLFFFLTTTAHPRFMTYCTFLIYTNHPRFTISNRHYINSDDQRKKGMQNDTTSANDEHDAAQTTQ